MVIRKPNLSVAEARRLASVRSAASEQLLGKPLEGKPHTAAAGAANGKLSSTLTPPPTAPALTASAQATTQPPAKIAAVPGLAGAATPLDSEEPAEQSPTAHKPISATKRKLARPEHGSATVSPPAAASVPLEPYSTDPEKIQVFLSAPLPAPGVSRVFELLCRQHRPKKALQMILRKALDDYEEMLEGGSFQQLAATYPCLGPDTAGSEIQTSRMIPKMLVAIARAYFDPLGFESTRAFGRKLGTAALAAFFAREARR